MALEPTTLAKKIRDKQISSVELLEHYVSRMEKYNPDINAIVCTQLDKARRRSELADESLARGESWGPLHGVPVTTKVNTDQAGLPNDGGVVAQKDKIADEDSPVIGSMRDAGAIVIGRTNTPTFSMRCFC